MALPNLQPALILPLLPPPLILLHGALPLALPVKLCF
jgi:hypothetical protein